jgi:hypothetical protein
MPEELRVISASQRTAARVAAITYPISFACVVYANFGLRADLLAGDNIAETVRHIGAATSMFRVSVGFDLVYCIGVIAVLAALYVVLSPVNRYLAVLATCWKLVYAVTTMLTSLTLLTITRLASDGVYVAGLQAEPLRALIRLNLSAGWDQYYVGLTFWALASTVFGWLWLRSQYIPAPLAVIALASSAWCAFCALAYIINPVFSHVVNLWWFDSPMALAEISISFWLLFKGLRGVAVPATSNGP